MAVEFGDVSVELEEGLEEVEDTAGLVGVVSEDVSVEFCSVPAVDEVTEVMVVLTSVEASVEIAVGSGIGVVVLTVDVLTSTL